MALTTAVSSVLQFLHAGYPEGVPRQDYIPLLALLRRRLTEDEVGEVANGLIASDDTASMRGSGVTMRGSRSSSSVTISPAFQARVMRA